MTFRRTSNLDNLVRNQVADKLPHSRRLNSRKRKNRDASDEEESELALFRRVRIHATSPLTLEEPRIEQHQPRTKQTARSSTGRGPRKQLASKTARREPEEPTIAKSTARKATGGIAPRKQLASKAARRAPEPTIAKSTARKIGEGSGIRGILFRSLTRSTNYE